ncbi:MAG: 1,4-alpha-glucan-branching enzyme, partial [Bacteroidales bacterium]|nr:1,4-alpha-glucan-branching enzyme [Bacteroidales bacterium]
MCAKKKMIYDTDKWLKPYKDVIDRRHKMILEMKERMSVDGKLCNGMNNHMFYGMHRDGNGGWVFREWAPNATKIYLIGDFNNWKRTEAYALKPIGGGNWEIRLSDMFLSHGTLYKLFIEWPGGGGERLPAYL